ncbi:PLP-dependent aminotransferase family protein [Pseudomonas sp. P2498]|uniref:PLP-dependent aminotransferase family protein n=1 Tax=Pseudomonas petrae TaxID=2912190 RepID=A0ABS9I4U0_9PSED|nr:PLP-dependent aminotransferase family protein [Pseudomonas petrae]MCF7535926.1 PLP-dependent aminotransferase family protein [Pseudomonas petrae]MCF7542787.1 PLP-dependent aminotransferase family protein [Pseudomonas petrae]MCF7554990.1 PLP-dependent aminotransferase family protein [Pseudomonas petrae]
MKKIVVDREETPPLYRQIYLRIRTSIADGRLKPGDRVPSIRALSSELNLARGTVENAYQQLINEGYLVGRGAAGTIVSPLLKPAPVAANTLPHSLLQTSLVHSGEPPLPFQMGLPALDAFPRKLWNRIVSFECRNSFLDGAIYPDARGHAALRSAVAGYLGVSRGIFCSPGQIFIVAGYRASLDLICRSVLQPGDRCWVEDPGYVAANLFLQEAGAELVPVPVDSDGMVVDVGVQHAPDARFAVVTPTHQSPLCVALAMPRRQALLDWASRNGSWIIEDDYDSEYRYQGRPLPALKSLDAQDRVLYCGTFSKVLLPGLRLAYLVVPNELVPRVSEIADKMHSHCPQLWQVATARFIEQGHFGRHLKKMRSLYSNRRQLLVEALLEKLSDCLSIDHGVGGMHLVARLNPSADDQAISQRAKDAGLRVEALSNWYLTPTAERGLLLSFTNVVDKQQAEQMVVRLAQVIRG